jgi:hypothetical protein
MVQDRESADLLAGWGVDFLQGSLTGSAVLDEPGDEADAVPLAKAGGAGAA